MDFMTGLFLQSISVFVFVFFYPIILLFIVSVVQTKLAIRQLLGAGACKYSVSYRIVF